MKRKLYIECALCGHIHQGTLEISSKTLRLTVDQAHMAKTAGGDKRKKNDTTAARAALAKKRAEAKKMMELETEPWGTEGVDWDWE